MAPKQIKPKQNGTKRQSVATELDGIQTATTDYEQQQRDEIEVLQSIYMDDFSEVETKAAWGNKQSDRAFKLWLKPMMQSDVEVAVTLYVRLTATYPKSVPNLDLEDPIGLRPKTLDRLQGLIKTKPKEMLGEVMIYELASGIQDILEDEAQFKVQGNAMPSLEEQRVAQEAETTELAKKREEEARQRKQEAQAEEDRMLQKMVEDEMSRRRDAGKKSRPVPTIAPEINANAAVIHLDRTVYFQSPATDIEFDAVLVPVLLNSGPLTQVSTVQPVLPQGSTEQSCLLVIKQLSLVLSTAGDKKQIRALEDELEALRKLTHPNIAQILDFRVDFGDKWSFTVLMEYARQGSLGEQLLTFGVLPVARVRIWLVEMLEALEYLHRHGIIHKRLHLNNILLVQPSPTSPLQIRLADAGFQESLYEMQASCAQKSSISSFSAYWNPPEGNDKTRKTDIWELGIVFLQMLFGTDAPQRYTGPSTLIQSKRLTSPLEDIIRQFFKADAKRRPTAFDLIPSEFLRTEVDVYSQQSSPLQSRHGSMIFMQTPFRQRLRRGSSGFLGPMFSRYANEWVEIGRLGKGGFGEVVKARNKMDGGIYAIKKIKQKTASALTEVLSEVMLLSRLNHPYVVRYFTAWPEEEEIVETTESEDTATITTTADADILSPGQFPENASIDFGQSTTGGLDFISSGFPKIQFGEDSEEESDDESSESEAESSQVLITDSRRKSFDSPVERNALALRRTSSSRHTRPVRSTLVC
jgi:translation initiation factor 2-alpha kinase 4